MRPTSPWPALAIVGSLTACTAPERAATTRGACDAFERPAEPIRGATRYSQRWADRTVEAGVSACGWARPRRAGAGA